MKKCALFLLAACEFAAPGSIAEREQSLECPTVQNTPVTPALVVTDKTVMERFSFKRTMTQLIASAGSTQTPTAVYQQWMNTYGAADGGCTGNGIDPNGYGMVCPRVEAALALKDPFSDSSTTQFVPLGVFNRFDLTPSDASSCGEYRIVYAMTKLPPPERAFLIFEGSLPNPTPALGLDGCLSIASFWQSLPANDPVALANRLEAFFYTGTAIPGVAPVVDAAHYGMSTEGTAHGAGQIRANMFMGPVEWNLREFQPKQVCKPNGKCSIAVQQVVVKENPANELFAGTHPKSPKFQASFLKSVPSLAGIGTDGGIALISMNIANGHDEFESIAQAPGSTVMYVNWAEASFKSAISTTLTQLGSPLTVDQLLNRASTQTCGGCHQLASNAIIGPGLTFPSNIGRFVHLDERGTFSSLLTTVLFPHRLSVLEGFINSRSCGVGVAIAPGMTVGGSAVGAPN